MTNLAGGCQCGAIRFLVTCAPTSTYICHCRMCQKAAGGPFGCFAIVPAAHFNWTRGSAAQWASSSFGVRQFCAACGTQVGYRYFDEREQYLTLGSFDDFQADIIAPTIQFGIESKVAWVDHLANLPSNDTEQSVSLEKLKNIINYQHPDHDTDAHWIPRPPEKD